MEVEIRPTKSTSEIPKKLFLLADPSEDAINNYLSNGNCLIAVIDEEIVGVVVMINKDSETIEVANIAVREDFQGNGIGKQLLSRAIETARNRNATRIEVGTGNSSLSQLGFYQRCGFRIFDIWEDYFIKHYKEEIFENRIQCRDMIRLKFDF